MKIVIAGGTGFLGRALTDALASAGHEVSVLSRRGARGSTGRGAGGRGPRVVPWTPDGSIGGWASTIDGADAVVNLAGESIAAGRWTEARKLGILESRVLSTQSLTGAILSARRPPPTFLSASAQGFYGEHGDEEVTEDTPPGRDFLARVCVAWEAEARKAAARTRLVLLRTGIVLSAEEGALPAMMRPFRMLAGGPVGSGRQYMSWIHWRDWLEMTRWALEAANLSGPLNMSAPAPVRNREFAHALGHALHRPSVMPAPGFALRLALGEMADALLLTSTRMIPKRALELGYAFRFVKLDEVLKDLLATGS